eukprot:TRINITY_DN112035_c0_g1_i1.p1 TRINITY_DN112035_c0_g1~~TRINITY_DN112035_c0_g1_i1.p1  ORF type:complete len:393 (-),score=70.05 TRINITY_DN112035_c0_g1_i1:185-1363(-)
MAAAAVTTMQPAEGGLERLLAPQRAFMDRFGDQLEQLLSVCVYLVPVEEDPQDVTGFYNQVLYSGIDLFNLYRTVLLRQPAAVPVCLPDAGRGDVECLASSSTRSRRLRNLRITYTAAAFILRGIRAVQVLLEMHATKTALNAASGQQRAPWRRTLMLCLRIEVVKLALKLILRKQMPFGFYVDEEALEDAEPPRTRLGAESSMGLGELSATDGTSVPQYVGRRSGRTLPALGAASTPGGRIAGSPAPPAAPLSIAGLANERSPDSPALFLADVLFHGRPFVHLFLLLRHGPRSWTAWLSAFLIDRISLGLLETRVRPTDGTRAAKLELAELQRRRRLIWYALARSPFFDKVLLRPCEVLDSIVKRIPILNMFNLVELFLALRSFYFATSAT